METRAHYTLIGAFTLTVIAAAFSFVFWFSGSDKGAARKTYLLVFSSSVSGLSRGAWVLFNGLRVGDVTRIDLADDPGKVIATIEIDQRTPVKTDTKARLEYQGLTGVASVALTGGSPGAAPVERGSDGAPPTIYAERSEFQNIVETLQNLSGKVENILNRADTLLNENSASITATIRNVEKISGGLADGAGGVKDLVNNFTEIAQSLKPFIATLEKNSDNIDSALRDARDLAARLSAASAKVDAFLTSAQNLIGGDGKRGMTDDISDAAKSIRKLADNLDVRTKEMTAGVNRVTGPALRQYEALAGDARRALDEVNRAVRSIEKNPQQLIFGAKPQVPEYGGR